MADQPPPRRPDLPAKIDRPTLVGYALAITATILSIPFVVLSGSFYAFPGDNPPSDWRSALWGLAFVVGTPSLIIGIVRYRRAGRLGDRRGRRWANGLIAVALTGATIWFLPNCLEAATGL